MVWEETERENRLLTERVDAMREDAERMTAALAAAEADAAEAARVATAATAARRDATAFERESARERRRARVDADVRVLARYVVCALARYSHSACPLSLTRRR